MFRSRLTLVLSKPSSKVQIKMVKPTEVPTIKFKIITTVKTSTPLVLYLELGIKQAIQINQPQDPTNRTKNIPTIPKRCQFKSKAKIMHQKNRKATKP